MKMNTSSGLAGPSTSIGIMRFFDQDTAGPRMTPEFVVFIAVGFTVLVIVMRSFFGA